MEILNGVMAVMATNSCRMGATNKEDPNTCVVFDVFHLVDVKDLYKICSRSR